MTPQPRATQGGHRPTTATRNPARASRARTPVNPIPKPGVRPAYVGVDKDPELDFVCGLIVQSGWDAHRLADECAKIGRPVSPYAIIGWLYGATKRPQNYTLTSVAMALGWHKEWSDGRGARFDAKAQEKVARVGEREHARKDKRFAKRKPEAVSEDVPAGDA